MILVTRRSTVAPLALLLIAASCGDDDPVARPDAPLAPDAAASVDATIATPDASAPDATVSLNPPRLWLAPINGSETNLQLAPDEPPHF